MESKELMYKEKTPIQVKIVTLIFLLGILFKQFYLRKSGSLQIGDVFLVIPFVITILIDKKIYINKTDIDLWIFIFSAIIINCIYMLIYNIDDFLINSVQLLYVICIVYITRRYYNYFYFNKILLIGFKIIIITQLVIFLLGKGGYFSFRYMGTFNNPNQFAYYIVASLFFIYVIDRIIKNKNNFIWFVISFYLIYLSYSTNMRAGLLLFVFLYIFGNSKKNKPLRLILVLSLTVIAIFILLNYDSINRYISITDGNNRIINKLTTIFKSDNVLYNYLSDREMTRILTYPIGFLYGTGAGLYSRYGSNYEIHSTFIAMAYYYGLIPFIFLVRWIYKNLSKSIIYLNYIYIPIIFIAFSIANQRQPFFWMLIAFGANQGIFCSKLNENQ